MFVVGRTNQSISTPQTSVEGQGQSAHRRTTAPNGGTFAMCLILFAYNAHPGYRLILAANRDEFHDRPASPLDFWEDHPQILAGRDLRQSGTWMGVTRDGKIAAITNYREPGNHNPAAPSRGQIISDFLGGSDGAGTYVDKIKKTADQFNGFNLLIGDLSALYYYSNRGGPPAAVERGIHGLSNRLLDTPWPKISTGRQHLAAIIDSNEGVQSEKLMALLQRQERPPDDQLPETGVGYAKEKMLSPIFITSPDYGTRCSTILTIDQYRHLTMTEITWKPGRSTPIQQCKKIFSFTIEDRRNSNQD
jgi:uncharacterized protein with NRDE domain